jgi:hypothetical protein
VYRVVLLCFIPVYGIIVREARSMIYDDTAVDSYLEEHDVYNSSDLCIDIAAVIRYAREHGMALSDVPQEIIDKYTGPSSQKVG